MIDGTSSTAQGGGGSFKNRKPIGEIGCCESGMARAKPLMDWKVLDLSHSFSLFLWLSTYLPIYFLCIYLSVDLAIYLSLSLFHLITYLPIYLSTYRPIYLSIYRIYLSNLSIYLSIYPLHLSIYCCCSCSCCGWCCCCCCCRRS